MDDWDDPDTEEMRKDTPEGFEWTCCRRQHDGPGCATGKHEAHPGFLERGEGLNSTSDTCTPKGKQGKGGELGEGGEENDEDEEDSHEEDH
ncbi:Fc.00g019970.m01.CDS01 [Cosmosporella sp. VM-42]